MKHFIRCWGYKNKTLIKIVLELQILIAIGIKQKGDKC